MSQYQILKEIVITNNLSNNGNLLSYIKSNIKELGYYKLSRISELANSNKTSTAAYYTDQEICEHMVSKLPEFNSGKKVLNVLEPSVGVGNFLPALFKKYYSCQKVNIDVIDIDPESIKVLKELISSLDLPENVSINFINDDFLLHNFNKKYDIVIGNPPYQKIRDKDLLEKYSFELVNTSTRNIFSFFIEKAIKLGGYVSLIIPKSTIYTPELEKTRKLIEKFEVNNITDYGEHGFKGVKIETISFLINTNRPSLTSNDVSIDSLILKTTSIKKQGYVFPKNLPSWILYRDKFFDSVINTLTLDVFNVVRDRQITKKHTRKTGKVRVLKSRNIGNCKIIDIPGYDSFVDDPTLFVISKFMNKPNIFAVPNLTYYPRACLLPKNVIADGSVALLTTKNKAKITRKDLEYFSSEEFTKFYRIVKNFGTRSLNVDKSAVYFWGVKKSR